MTLVTVDDVVGGSREDAMSVQPMPVGGISSVQALPESPADDDGPAVTSVSKALRLLASFRGVGPVAGVSELARLTGLPKSTAFRLLAQLEASGYLERSGTDYRLDRMLFELGNCVPMCSHGDLRSIAGPFLSDLFLRSRYVVHLAVLDGVDVVYLDKIHGHGNVRVPTKVGGRMRASCSALGKAMLPFGHREAVEQILQEGLARRTPHSIAAPGLFVSELNQVRKHGVAFDREEAALGLTCVAAPIISQGVAVAAVSVSGPTGRFDPVALAKQVQSAAREISALYARRLVDQGLEATAG
ncbi:IclR family transcriptional regulator [Nocardioides sp. cx-173]|uniref:IclR family transcriptional regulator n=1 Tax=Nocardioides sp. cx-173 TaxID=2898796 RepID=UPI001E28A8CF|nr:IclR family transcriptional regulator [Nocardioides sp. cx-173]UGB40685.1 IclR family transcriptional regulator [Nocardioides sp. cx-173]